MRRPPRALAILAGISMAFLAAAAEAADTKQLAVTAVVLSRSNCQFTSNVAATLDFGSLDAFGGPDVVKSVSFNARCVGGANPATFTITQDGGLYGTGPGRNRMRHVSATAEFVPYSLAIGPSADTVPRNQAFPVTVTGTVLGASYRDVMAGNYADSVRITINP